MTSSDTPAATVLGGRSQTVAPRVGLYPGTFDPVTLGHLDIVRRSLRLVDHLVIGVAINRDKGPMFSLEERVAMIEAECGPIAAASGGSIEVRPFETLLMSFAEELGASVIVRGLRAVADFEYEFQMVGMNRAMNDQIEMAFLMADPNHQAIASKLVKEIARLGGDISKFVTPGVRQALLRKCGR
ncbi:MAG: pantetheine-phosphate adenylyltransferase [Rhodobacteraceae bacterium]|nr:pantetheine-phosphate adenylyltransferase [Paracoccaceae bacterium]